MYRYTIQKGLEFEKATENNSAIVYVDTKNFVDMLMKMKQPMLVHTFSATLFKKKHQYLTVYRELYFYTESKAPINIPSGVEPEVVSSEKIKLLKP
jgi:hypothetical protein